MGEVVQFPVREEVEVDVSLECGATLIEEIIDAFHSGDVDADFVMDRMYDIHAIVCGEIVRRRREES